MSNLSELATINFYTWESRGRGYYLFDNPVKIEPPYVPFEYLSNTDTDYYDDGKVTLLGRLKSLVSADNTNEDLEVEPQEILPIAINPQPALHCLKITFPNQYEFSLPSMYELLNLLSFSEHPFSFEILAHSGSIEVQLTAQKNDILRLESHLKAFFPMVIITSKEALDINFDFDKQVAIADFGLDNEFMLPIAQSDKLNIDPLTSIIATLETLEENDTAIFQVLFKGVTAPWSRDIQRAASDGVGGSFFEGYPEFSKGTQEKISNPLFSVVIRIAAQGNTKEHSRYISQELARSITTVSASEYNRLIPLSNEGYEYDDHLRNIFYRTSNRLGFFLNIKELAHFVHYPNKTIVSKKLNGIDAKTKRFSHSHKQGIYIGRNVHQGESLSVNIDDETRLSHTHIIGVTGVGKSTLIANMILQDIEQGLGIALFDPHGDNCDDILKRIPRHRMDDVIVIDPSDSEYPIGFNLLEAHSDVEKIVLSSDLVSAFKNHATAWGDNMTAVLQNVVNTMLESTQGGTLIELKRFLLEEKFRGEYLDTVDDPSLQYYWRNEYPLVRKGIAPLLTRIDTFLRPRLVRYMLAQKSGVDINSCLANNSIVLIKLSQGLIGESNSYLLGSLFLAKFNQAALARQNIERAMRTPYMLYLDEFQNFITPSIERMLSGARKYGLGLTLAHQELGQISDSQLHNSVISNPKTRICFRLGDADAKRLESGFSYFEQSDLMNLERGQAIVRIGSQSNDFNLATQVLSEKTEDMSSEIIDLVRMKYAKPKDEVEAIITSLLPQYQKKDDKGKRITDDIVPIQKDNTHTIIEATHKEETESQLSTSTLETKKDSYLKEVHQEEQEQIHRSIQHYVRTIGQQRGFVAELETQTNGGGRIDVTLKKDDVHIAVEVSVTNTVDYEVQNITKCLGESFSIIYVISESKIHLSNIKKRAKENIETKAFKKVKFGSPSDFLSFLNAYVEKPKKSIKKVRGYRVKTSHIDINSVDASKRNEKIQDIIVRAKKKK